MNTIENIHGRQQKTDRCLMVIDKEGTILYANPLLVDTLHFKEKFIAQSNIYDLLNPCNYTTFKEILEHADHSGSPGIIDLRLQNGVVHEMRWQINKLLSSSSPATNYLCIGHQITKNDHHQNTSAEQVIADRKEEDSHPRREQTQHEIKIAETIVRVQERERAYISHELHDNVIQILASAKLYLRKL